MWFCNQNRKKYYSELVFVITVGLFVFLTMNACMMGNLKGTESQKTPSLDQSQEMIPTDSGFSPNEMLVTITPPPAFYTQKTIPTLIITTSTVTSFPKSRTSTISRTPLISQTNTPTPVQTYAILRGKVVPEHANCRYGPGAPYLYKYGLVGGSNLEIIGRDDLGSWLLIQAIGGSNPCWVKAELMEIRGDLDMVQPVPPDIIQAWSPYYPPITGVSAARNGETVLISWHPLQLRAGDDSEQIPYIVEAWICKDNNVFFTPIGTYNTSVEVIDEEGCSEISFAQVIAAEKHGYTKPVLVPWPSLLP
jgi:hypothetical protein